MAENAQYGENRSQESESPQGQAPAGGETGNYWQSIDMQMAALVAVIIATVLSIMVLQGIKDQREGRYPCKDYSFIDEFPRISTAITAAVALYFLYLAWVDHKKNPESSTLTWLFVANAFALGAASVKLDVLYLAPENDTEVEDVIEEAVE